MAENALGRKLLPEEHIEERRLFVLDCKKKAWSFYRIAAAVTEKWGYPISAMQVSQDYRTIMRRRTEELKEETDAQRNLMLDQIDSILEKHLELAQNGDTDAAEICVKLFTRRARITGIDAPLKSERKDVTPRPRMTEAQLMERMRDVLSKLGVMGSIPGSTPAKVAQFPAGQVIEVTPAMLSQGNNAELTAEERFDRQDREDVEPD